MKLVSSRSYVTLLSVAAFSIVSVGCETVEGVGEDIEELGDELEDQARDAQR